MDERLLSFARELEARDERAAAAIATLSGLGAAAEEVRDRARALRTFLASVPAERERVALALAGAREDVARRAEAVRAAELRVAELDRGGEEGEQLAAARRALVSARDAAATAETIEARVAGRKAELERQAEAAGGETRALDARARAVAPELAAAPRVSAGAAAPPREGLDALEEWGSRARAAILVARSGFERERDALAREANELGTAALGDATGAASVARVRERIERALA